MNAPSHYFDDAGERFKVLVSIITAEADLIWARFRAYLIANLVLVAVMAVIGAFSLGGVIGLHKVWPLLFVIAAIGLHLSYIWLKLTRIGWDLEHDWVVAASRIDWAAGERNPFATYVEWSLAHGGGKGMNDPIGRCASATIWLFLLLHTTCIVGLLCWQMLN